MKWPCCRFLDPPITNSVRERPPLPPPIRFKSSNSEEGLTSIADYVSRMKEGQKNIYFLIGELGCVEGWDADGRLALALLVNMLGSVRFPMCPTQPACMVLGHPPQQCVSISPIPPPLCSFQP